MRIRSLLPVLPFVCSIAWGEPDAVLDLVGRGVEGHKPYRGGKVEFLDLTLADQLVHFEDETAIPLRLTVSYRVDATAPVWLTSRLGTECWRLIRFTDDSLCALYTDEHIDLSKPGRGRATSTHARIGARYGPPLSKGLVGIRGRRYFLIDRPDGRWLDVVDPPPFFSRLDLARKLCFTLADLHHFTLMVTDFESTWRPGGAVRVRVMVTDADSDRFPVVNMGAHLDVGTHRMPLHTEFDEIDAPTGWLRGKLPPGALPDSVTVQATVNALTPQGPRTETVKHSFPRGYGRRSSAQLSPPAPAPQLPRTRNGMVRETRALWVAGSDILTREDIDRLVARAAEARLNLLLPDVFVRNTFIARSPLQPTAAGVAADFDPLAYLIAQAHAGHLEVHPWFCVTYRDAAFRKRLGGVDMIDAEGKVIPMGADVHRPKYRDFIVQLMVGVARDYAVDGIHLDYIRTMGRCYCDACKREFRQAFGKELTEATADDWLRWQRSAVADIVRRTAAGVRAARPQAKLSAAVFSNMAAGAAQGQDPAGWAHAGWLDMVIPMDYDMEPLGVKAHEKAFLAALDHDDKLVTGLSLYVRNGAAVSSRTPARVSRQVQLVRRLGIHGYCLFVYRYLNDDLLGLLRDRLNVEPAIPYFR